MHVNHVPVALIHPITNAYFVHPGNSPLSLTQLSVKLAQLELLARKAVMTANDVQKEPIQITLNVFHVNLGRIPLCQVCPLVKNARLGPTVTLLEVLNVKSVQMER